MITFAKHLENGSIYVQWDDNRVSTIPDDMKVPMRQLVAEWEAEGNTIDPYVAPDPLIAWREAAWMDRAGFVNGAADLGLLTDEEAIAAAQGAWPTSFNVALPSDPSEARRAKVLWASTATISRNADLIAAIIASPIPITEAQVDALFGR
jgi:hypothetical protein